MFAALFLTLVPTPAKAGTPTAAASRIEVWVAERVSPQARGFTLWANFSWGADGGLVAHAVFRRDHSKLVPLAGLAWDQSGPDGPYASFKGNKYGCLPGSLCSVSSGQGISAYASTLPDSETPVDVVMLVVKGSEQEVSLHNSPGWRLRRTNDPARLVGSDATGNEAAVLAGDRIEHFTGVVGTGGTHGSVAIAAPPCKPADQVGYAREGYGSASLTGGRTSAQADCGAGSPDVVAIADRATRWRFSGDVTGVALGPTRLVIVDLPAANRL